MRRVWVVGTSGSGKTTLAREIARRLAAPHTELDALYWGPRWTPRPREAFVADVATAVDADAWVIDGNYESSGAADLIRPRADALVGVDPPRVTVMRRVVARTIRRTLTRSELWHGNREGSDSLFGRDSVVRWAWTTYARNQTRYGAAESDPTSAHLARYRLRTRAARDAFLTRLP